MSLKWETWIPGGYKSMGVVDGGAGTRVFRMTRGLEDVAYLMTDLNFIPFVLTREGSNSLIAGPGGGQEVLLALLGKTREVTAVDGNPSVFSVVRRFMGFRL